MKSRKISVEKDTNGRVIGYKTYATKTGTVDEETVEPEYILGEYTGKYITIATYSHSFDNK